jgi:hypothetical protein
VLREENKHVHFGACYLRLRLWCCHRFWYDIGVVVLVVFRFIGCAILFFALVVGISLAVVGLSDSVHDDFREAMSLIAITVTLCLVAAALLLFLYGM